MIPYKTLDFCVDWNSNMATTTKQI